MQTNGAAEVYMVKTIAAAHQTASESQSSDAVRAAWTTALWQLAVMADNPLSEAFLDFLFDFNLPDVLNRGSIRRTDPETARIAGAAHHLHGLAVAARKQAQDLATFQAQPPPPL